MKVLFLFDIDLTKLGPSVHLLNGIMNAATECGVDYDVISRDRIGQYEQKRGFIYRYFEEIFYAHKCKKEYLKNKYDVVFLQSNNVALFYLLGLRKLKCPVVYNVQDIFPYNLKFSNQLPFSKITFPVFRFLQNVAYRRASRIVTISEDMKHTLIEDGISEGKIDVIYNWSYSDEPIIKENITENNYYDLHLNSALTNVVYAGNIGRMQNVELIVKAAFEMSNDDTVHFYIIGDGSNKDNVKSLANCLENVTFLPMQQSNFAESIYAQADINVIPLMPGGIKTALPSKTATVLRANKPIVFCVDPDNELASVFKDMDSVVFVDAENCKELKKAIKILQEKSVSSSTSSLQQFSVKNAYKYIDVLLEEANG